MSSGQNYRSLLGPGNPLDGTNDRDIPLESLEPVYIPPSDDDPSAQGENQPLPPPDQSPNALDERLYDELCKGVYECPICTDVIELEDQMWSCKDCHHIYHFPCAKEWAQKRRDNVKFRTWRWPCPTCKRLQIGGNDVMTPACWCGRWRHHHVDVIGNSCGKKCPGYKTCESPGPKCERFCQKLCHPGPCEPVVCVPSCALIRFPHFKTGKKQVKNVYQSPQPPPRARVSPYGPPRREQADTTMARMEREMAAMERLAQRDARPAREERPDREPNFELLGEGETSATIFMLLILVAWEVGMWYWVKFHTNRWVSPLQYKDFTAHNRSVENGLGIALGCVIITFIKTIFAAGTFYHVGKCLVHHLHLPGRSSWRAFVLMFTILATLAFAIAFPIGYLSSPKTRWNAQMKHSCEGFETRVKLDGIDGDSIAASKIFLYEPNKTLVEGQFWQPVSRAPGLDTFNITKKGTTKMAKLSPAPFATYHRLSRAYTEDNPMLIDFDLTHYVWRIMTPSNGATPETIVRNGTWTNTTNTQPHAHFPELNLQATNLHFFAKSCVYQPFLTIFRTDGMDAQAITAQSERKWETKSESNVVMRTASFGAGQQHLEVCARRKEYEVLGEGGEIRRGLGEDIVVPLGLLAVVRRQMRMDKKLPGDCWGG